TFKLTNTGDYPIADNITIEDLLFEDPIELDFGDGADVAGELQPGEYATAEVDYTITQEDIDNGGVYNQATASGEDLFGRDVEGESKDPDPLDPGDPNYDGDCHTCTFTLLPQNPSIELVKT